MVRRISENESIELLSSERFRPRENDEELLWKVIEITGEKRDGYKVKWEGDDPDTRKPWPQSWVAKGDVTDDLVKTWKLKKKKQVAGPSKKLGKSSFAGLGASAATGPRSSSTRRSASTVKASTPATSTTASRRRSVRSSAVVDEMPQEKPPDRRSLSRLAESATNPRQESISSKSLKQNRKLKRRREISVASDASVSLPEIVTIPEDTPVARPRKKLRLNLKQQLLDMAAEDGGEESFWVRKPTERRHHTIHQFDIESEEEDLPGRGAGVDSSGPKGRRLYEGGEEAHEDEDVTLLSSNPKRGHQPQQTTEAARAKRSKEDPTREHSNPGGVAPRAELLDQTRQEGEVQETRPPDKSSRAERRADIHTPKVVRSSKRDTEELSREVSPDTCERLRRFDAELVQLERERRKQEADIIARQQNVEEDEGSALEYYDDIPPPGPPNSSVPHRRSSPLSRKPSIIPATTGYARPVPQLPPTTKRKINGKGADDSYRQGIVPETELEDSTTNTQSHELSQSQPVSQSVLSLPSMAVEPPTSLRSQPPTPPQSTRPRKSNSHGAEESGLHPLSQDADVSELLDTNEPGTEDQLFSPQKVAKSGKQMLLSSTPAIGSSILAPPSPSTALKPNSSARPRSGGDGTDGLMSSIEQFSSPEKHPKPGGKSGERRGAFDEDSLRRRGQELADSAREAKRQTKLQTTKKPLTQILIRKSTNNSHKAPLNGDAFSTVNVFTSSTETASPITSSVLRIMPAIEHSFSDVPEEVVQEMEAAYVDLDGGTNNQTEDDVMQDESLQKSAELPSATRPSVLALRQEEEESTQDLYQQATDAAGQPEKDAKIGADGVEPSSMTYQDTQHGHEVVAQPTSAALSTSEKLEALLQQERQRNQSLQDELLALQKAFKLAKANVDSELQELREAKDTYDRDKGGWESERASLISAAEAATKAKADATKECDFFREQYARASGFVTSVRAENEELEKRAKIAEDRATSGVAMITATYETRVKTLESHVDKWQTMATFLIQKDQRTDNDELRRRAAEEPELRARCKALEEGIDTLHAELSQVVTDLSSREKLANEAVYWKQQTERLAGQLNDTNAELERLSRASIGNGNDLLYRCKWQTDANKPCGEVFPTGKDLEGHLFSAGHMQ